MAGSDKPDRGRHDGSQASAKPDRGRYDEDEAKVDVPGLRTRIGKVRESIEAAMGELDDIESKLAEVEA